MASTGADINETDEAGMIAWMDSYCKKNPLDNIFTAAVRLSDAMMKKRHD